MITSPTAVNAVSEDRVTTRNLPGRSRRRFRRGRPGHRWSSFFVSGEIINWLISTRTRRCAHLGRHDCSRKRLRCGRVVPGREPAAARERPAGRVPPVCSHGPRYRRPSGRQNPGSRTMVIAVSGISTKKPYRLHRGSHAPHRLAANRKAVHVLALRGTGRGSYAHCYWKPMT